MSKRKHTSEFEDCIKKVMAKGKDKASAYAICTAAFQKAGKPIWEKTSILATNPIKEKIVEKPLRIRGIAIKAGESRNRNIYLPEELKKAAAKLVGAPVYIELGGREDYLRLAGFHYRSHRLPPYRRIFRAVKDGETVGVIVYSYPALTVSARKNVLGEDFSFHELNENLSCISRVVVHPKYRSIGLGQKLVRETLAACGTPYVETIAVMAKYNPFFEKAGMKKITEQKPPKKIVEIANQLLSLGFNLERMSSRSYNLKVLRGLSQKELNEVRNILAKYPHPRLVRHLSPKMMFMNKRLWRKALNEASIEKLAGLIRLVSILSQTKVYLFWRRNEADNNDK